MTDILILGAGFGGLEAATGLSERLGDQSQITLIDKSDHFIIGFSKFEVMFGRDTAEGVKSYYKDVVHPGVKFVQDTIERIDPENRLVTTHKNQYTYDYLIIALGAELAPEATPGFVEGGYEFYSLAGAQRLWPVLDQFQGGHIILSVFDKPYKCPPAPYEAMFQLHDLYSARGIREQVELTMMIFGPKALPVAQGAAEVIEQRFAERNITLLTNHKVSHLDPAQKQVFVGEQAFDYDLFIGVPLHRPPQVIRQSVLGQNGWVQVNKRNLETVHNNVYAIGDVTKIPVGGRAVPKAGAFAENGAQAVVADINNKITGSDEPVIFEAVGTCFFEFGDDEVAQIQANFLGQAEPQVKLAEPTADFRAEKERFVSERLGRWFQNKY